MNIKKNISHIGMTYGFVVAIITLIILLTLNYLTWQLRNSPGLILLFFIQIIISFIIFIILYSILNYYHSEEDKLQKILTVSKEQEEKLTSLYTVLKTHENIKDLYKSAVQAGISSLGCEIGILTKIEGSLYEVLYSEAPQELNTADIGKTCCTITLYSNSSVTIDNMGNSVFHDHLCYKNFKFESYIGTTVTVQNKKYGTLIFLSKNPRLVPFNESDRNFVQLIAKLLAIAIEHQQWAEELRSNREELEWLNKIKIGRELRMIELKREIAKLKGQKNTEIDETSQ